MRERAPSKQAQAIYPLNHELERLTHTLLLYAPVELQHAKLIDGGISGVLKTLFCIIKVFSLKLDTRALSTGKKHATNFRRQWHYQRERSTPILPSP